MISFSSLHFCHVKVAYLEAMRYLCGLFFQTTMAIQIKDEALRKGAAEGMDEFLQVFIDAYEKEIGGELTAEAMTRLNGYQLSLLAYHHFRREVNEGGFIQLIYNGYGGFIFENPFAKAMRLMGAKEFSKLVYSARKIYDANKKELTREKTDEEFMATYEQFEEFDDLEEEFMEMEEFVTATLAAYVDEHIEDFGEIVE